MNSLIFQPSCWVFVVVDFFPCSSLPPLFPSNGTTHIGNGWDWEYLDLAAGFFPLQAVLPDDSEKED